jgi:iron complex outermembrane receptor protein
MRHFSWRIATSILTTLVLVVGAADRAQGQGTGRITGLVTEAETDAGVGNVQIAVEGTGLGTVSGQRGTFSIANVPAGDQTLVFNILGYETHRETVAVEAGGVANADVALVAGYLEMGTITVIGASRRPTRIVEAPAAVSVVSGEELQRGAPHGQLPKLFQGKPGIDVVQSGVQDFNINARGYNSSLNRRVLVLQDGVDRSLGFLQSQEWTSLSMPLEDLGRLDFVRGPGSALYGANAFSGVLNITTPAPGDIIGSKLSASGGQRETGRIDFRHAGQSESGNWGYKGNLGFVSVGNSFSESRTQADAVGECPGPPGDCEFEYGPLPVEVAPVDEDAVNQLYGSARLDHNFNNGSLWSLEGGSTHVENEIFVTGIGRVQINGANRPWFRSQYASERFTAMGWYSGRRSNDRGADGNNQTSLQSGLELREVSDIFHLELQGNVTADDGAFQLVGGISNRWYSVDTEGTLMDDEQDDTITSVFGQAEYQFNPMFSALFALRFDHFTVIDADEVAPKAAIVLSPDANNSIRFTFNRAYQIPNYSELFLNVPVGRPQDLAPLEAGIEAAVAQATGCPDAPTCVPGLPLNYGLTPVLARGNDDLGVEELTGYEVGYKGTMAGGRVFATVDVYFNKIDDFVTDLLPGVNPDDFAPYELPTGFGPGEPLEPLAPIVLEAIETALGPRSAAFTNLADGSPAFVVSYTNAGEVSEQGVELGFTFLLTPNLEVDANYTYFNFDIDDNTSTEGAEIPEDELLPNTPENKGNIGITYSQPDRFHAGVKVHMQDAMDWAAGVFAGSVPGYATADLTGGFNFNENTRVNLVWTNVLDKEHYQLYGGSVLGSRAIGGVTFTF